MALIVQHQQPQLIQALAEAVAEAEALILMAVAAVLAVILVTVEQVAALARLALVALVVVAAAAAAHQIQVYTLALALAAWVFMAKDQVALEAQLETPVLAVLAAQMDQAIWAALMVEEKAAVEILE